MKDAETRMDILLWRHAEAEDGTPDLERMLTARGEEQARQMAEWIKAHGPKKLRILASPTVRTQQTAEALGMPFETDKRLAPDSSVSDLLAAVGWLDVRVNTRPYHSALVIGHQPTLGQTASLLLAGEESPWPIKKGAMWWFSRRVRRESSLTTLKLVISPEFLR